jgi:hypothetical protein
MYSGRVELRLTIFLAFISLTVVTNALLIWLVYKTFVTFTSTVTTTLAEIEKSDAARVWLPFMQRAAEQAVSVTEITKQKMAGNEVGLARAQERYGLALKKLDSKLEKVGNGLCANARKVRDASAKPAFSILSFAAGVSQLLKTFAANK